MKSHYIEITEERLHLSVEVIRSKRKTMAIELHPQEQCIVRAPFWVADEEIERFVISKADWIERKAAELQEKEIQKSLLPTPELTEEALRQLTESAKKTVSERVWFFAPLVGVTFGRITIRRQVSRWGSCSAKGNLNFNCLLMLCPPSVLDYVVVHELCHRKEMNHSPRFWQEVERVFPAYSSERRWLRENGRALVERLPSKK